MVSAFRDPRAIPAARLDRRVATARRGLFSSTMMGSAMWCALLLAAATVVARWPSPAAIEEAIPRILLPQGRSLFRDLVPRGQRLIEWHTLRAPAPDMNGVTADKLLEFRAGGHQLLRPSRIQSAAALDHPLAPYVAATLAEMSAIDEAIQEYGGFPAAFLS